MKDTIKALIHCIIIIVLCYLFKITDLTGVILFYAVLAVIKLDNLK